MCPVLMGKNIIRQHVFRWRWWGVLYLRRHGAQHFGRVSSRLVDHFVEKAVFVLQQIMRTVEFDHRTAVHDDYPVRVHNRVEPVSYYQYGATSEFLPDGVLNQRVGPANENNGCCNCIRRYLNGIYRFWLLSGSEKPRLRPLRSFGAFYTTPWPRWS